MQKNITISLFEVIGSHLCVASGDGQEIYDRIEKALQAERDIVLSFHNITALTPAFLNTAIG